MTVHLFDAIYSASASGANATYNLCNEPIGTDAVGLGIIAANAAGPFGRTSRASESSELYLLVRNSGTAEAYLARPEDIPSAGTETEALTTLRFPVGETVEVSGLSLKGWSRVLRLLDGANLTIEAGVKGTGYRRAG